MTKVSDIAFNQSRIKTFRRCQRQYGFRYDTKPGKELVPKLHSLPLKRGSWLHALQEEWHKEWAGVKGASWAEKHLALAEEFNSLFEEERVEYGDLPGECLRLFRAYLRYTRREGDEESYTVATLRDGTGPAVEFIVELPLSQFGIDRGRFKGRIDLLVEDHEYGGLWIWDAKWVKTIPAPDERMMSPQSLLYAWALRELGYDIQGFVYNYGRTKPPTVPHMLQRGVLSTAARMDTNYETYLQAIKDTHGKKWKLYAKQVYIHKLRELKEREGQWFRRERIPVEQSRVDRAVAEYFITIGDMNRRTLKNHPRTYQYDCKWSCPYHDLCVAEFTGLDIKPLIKRSFVYEEERYGASEEAA